VAARDLFVCTPLTARRATAAAVVIDPVHRTLRYSRAGHPPALLRAPDGTVTTLDQANGLLLGLCTSDRPERVVTYKPGSCLVLFTDGLVERRGDASIELGIGRLAGLLARASPPTPGELCDILVHGSLPSGMRQDDTAVLCAYLS
jgi:serine phosphatase RsbU (regulator of sigma subunit)